MKQWMLVVTMLVAAPLAAQSHKADGKVTLNGEALPRLEHAYGYVHDAKDEEANITVVFTDKPVPKEWDLRQFDTSAPSGLTALVLHMVEGNAQKATLYHASGTFTIADPKLSEEWSQMGEAIEGRVYLAPTTLEDGATTMSFNVKFELEVE